MTHPTTAAGSPASRPARRRPCAYPTLELLNLDGSGLTDAGLLALARAPRLDFLSVRGTRVTEAGIAAFRAARSKVGLETGPALPPSTRPALSGYP